MAKKDDKTKPVGKAVRLILPDEWHQELRIAGALIGKMMSECVTDHVIDWLREHKKARLK